LLRGKEHFGFRWFFLHQKTRDCLEMVIFTKFCHFLILPFSHQHRHGPVLRQPARTVLHSLHTDSYPLVRCKNLQSTLSIVHRDPARGGDSIDLQTGTLRARRGKAFVASPPPPPLLPQSHSLPTLHLHSPLSNAPSHSSFPLRMGWTPKLPSPGFLLGVPRASSLDRFFGPDSGSHPSYLRTPVTRTALPTNANGTP